LNDQEQFWQGAFGNEYTQRNLGHIAANFAFFAPILRLTRGVGSVIELGCGAGGNLAALRHLLPQAQLTGVEINASARELAQRHANLVVAGSLLEFRTNQPADFAFTKGVLIHIAPENLEHAYAALYQASRRYLMVGEYYSPNPVEIDYRGHAGRLWKRDFAGDLLDRYADLRLVDYGFVWRRDPQFRQDDLNWFLLEKIPTA
jgi:pseudaminic acid biosynthesis-associated methylase